MEHVSIQLSKPELFDSLVHGGLPQASAMQVVTKDKGTDQGNPIVVIAFDVQMPDGTVRQVQATTTVRLFQQAAAATIGRYGHV